MTCLTMGELCFPKEGVEHRPRSLVFSKLMSLLPSLRTSDFLDQVFHSVASGIGTMFTDVRFFAISKLCCSCERCLPRCLMQWHWAYPTPVARDLGGGAVATIARWFVTTVLTAFQHH